MSRPAYQALMVWDNPLQFEDRKVYRSIHELITLLLEKNPTIMELAPPHYYLLREIVVGSIEAVSNTIQAQSDPQVSHQLVPILEDLNELFEELDYNAQH